ncbi:MAG: DUF2029 domain-containing protein [Nitrospinae bacterium]|nr:DUF2029 domain-containing protein [Nitrospinota bacterium]
MKLNPYETYELKKLARNHGYEGEVYSYVYPPFFGSVLMYPFTFFSYLNALKLWFWFNIFFLYLAFFVLYQLIRSYGKDGRGDNELYLMLFIGAMLLTFNSIAENFRWGQVNIFIFAALVLFFHFYLKEKNTWAGLCLSILALIKIGPVLLLFFLFLLRRYRIFFHALFFLVFLTALSVWIVGVENTLFYVKVTLPTYSFGNIPYETGLPPGDHGNSSLNGFFSSIFVRSILALNVSWENPGLGKAVYLFSIFLLIGDAIAQNRKSISPSGNMGKIVPLSNIVILYTLMSSVTWEHHLISICVPLAVIGAVYLNERPNKWWTVSFVLCWLILSMDIERSLHHFVLNEIVFANKGFFAADPHRLRPFLLIMPVKFYALVLLWFHGRKARQLVSQWPRP